MPLSEQHPVLLPDGVTPLFTLAGEPNVVNLLIEMGPIPAAKLKEAEQFAVGTLDAYYKASQTALPVLSGLDSEVVRRGSSRRATVHAISDYFVWRSIEHADGEHRAGRGRNGRRVQAIENRWMSIFKDIIRDDPIAPVDIEMARKDAKQVATAATTWGQFSGTDAGDRFAEVAKRQFGFNRYGTPELMLLSDRPEFAGVAIEGVLKSLGLITDLGADHRLFFYRDLANSLNDKRSVLKKRDELTGLAEQELGNVYADTLLDEGRRDKSDITFMSLGLNSPESIATALKSRAVADQLRIDSAEALKTASRGSFLWLYEGEMMCAMNPIGAFNLQSKVTSSGQIDIFLSYFNHKLYEAVELSARRGKYGGYSINQLDALLRNSIFNDIDGANRMSFSQLLLSTGFHVVKPTDEDRSANTAISVAHSRMAKDRKSTFGLSKF